MLTKGDEYPLHQTPEPMAVSGGNRNFYDRYFFNGYASDGSVFFAAALGVYPQLDIMDAAFCVSVDGKQYNLRASKRMSSERLDMSVGPIRIEIVEPLQQIRLIVSENDSPVTADITVTMRHSPIEEPRFIRRDGPRLFMDYTRLTQNGDWSGTITVDGQELDVTGCRGTRDRSWGIRPVGAPESQPPPMGAMPQFWWLWTPLNFDNHCCFFHSNDDGEGEPWNRRGVVDTIGGVIRWSSNRKISTSAITRDRGGSSKCGWKPATACSPSPRALATDALTFYMSGLGYMHPDWGHGLDHGGLEVAHDVINLNPEPADRHDDDPHPGTQRCSAQRRWSGTSRYGDCRTAIYRPAQDQRPDRHHGPGIMSAQFPVRSEEFEKSFVEKAFGASSGIAPDL